MRDLVHHLRRARLLCLAAGVPLILGLASCSDNHPTQRADSEGVYVTAGRLTYQVQLSRELNPFSIEDRAYINGASDTSLKANQLWFGVFLWAKNWTKQPRSTTDSFDIVDTQGNRFHPIKVDPHVNPFAWTSTTLPPLGTQPAPDSPGQFSPTQGHVLLFKLNNSVFANRPLTLEIYVSGQPRPSEVSIDL